MRQGPRAREASGGASISIYSSISPRRLRALQRLLRSPKDVPCTELIGDRILTRLLARCSGDGGGLRPLLHRDVDTEWSRLKQHPHPGVIELDEYTAPVLHVREADTTAHGGRRRDASVISGEVLDVL